MATHGDLLREMARKAIESDVELAATLSTIEGRQSPVLTGPEHGDDRSVASPPPEPTASGVVRIHTHPEEAQVTFSTTDIVSFVNNSLPAVPFGRLPDGPHGYAVVGRRGDDLSENEAQLQTIEPNDAWAQADPVTRRRVENQVARRADESLTRQEDNPLFDLMQPYIHRESLEFPTRPQRAQS